MDDRRKIVTRSPHRRVGYIHCPWIQLERVEYESLLERDFVRIALLSPGLLGIQSQPFRLDLAELGTYTPDYLLIYPKNINLVVEVKPHNLVGSEKYQKLFTAAHRTLAERNFVFQVATEKSIRSDDRHERASILLRYAKSKYANSDLLRALAFAGTYPQGVRISDLSVGANVSNELVLHLIAKQSLSIGRQLNFSPNHITKITSKGEQDGSIHPSTWLGCKDWSTAF